MKTGIIITLIVVAAGLAASQLLTVFVIQPIGAIPEGRTLIISRLNNTNFIDSADAMCEREMGGVSLMCRVMVMGAVAKNGTIYARLPYSSALYGISTGGKSYER